MCVQRNVLYFESSKKESLLMALPFATVSR
jgi:hypothetical protein